jgi:type IV pilus assembly protein PilY1
MRYAMKNISRFIKSLSLLIILSIFLMYPLLPSPSHAAEMNNYCITPPFIVGGVNPNLLMMIDNSASMYDLTYLAADNAYCYDKTYSSSNTYVGYFEKDLYYNYDMTDDYFYKVSTFPAYCNKYIANTVCIDINTSTVPATVERFIAKGNYLNWLSASKFDVQKGILTGGKYNPETQKLIAESRGCVGRKFIKEALTSDYVEGGTNTSLGITFGVRGPLHPFNVTLPSLGGQTYIDIFVGDYNEGLCQAAVDAFIAGHDPASIKKAVEDCLSATVSASAYCQKDTSKNCSKNSDCIVADGKCERVSGVKVCTEGDPAKIGGLCNTNANCDTDYGPCISPTATTDAKTKVVFNQAIQACWAFSNGTPISIDEVNTVKNQCTDLYDENYICSGDPTAPDDGKTCTPATGCLGSGSCISGPMAIRPGNPSHLCSSTYTGACYSGAPPSWPSSWEGCYGGKCGNDCIIERHEAFCVDVKVPPVIDPSDDPSTTENYDNLPAIIGDIGIEAQLGVPVATLIVKVHLSSAPGGLIQEFESLIRMGAMTFNFFGSPSECPENIPCPKICSGSGTVCGSNLDCPAFETCVDATNMDGGKVIRHIENVCSTTKSTICNTDTDCPDGEKCTFLAGDHTSGLINKIDNIPARTWTPFAEGFYNAIGYFARTNSYTEPIGISRTDLRIHNGDFEENKNPSQYRCQANNILLITDGMSTADQHPDVHNLAVLYSQDGQTGWTATSPKFAGSRNLDDLAWLAKNRNIKTFSKEIAFYRDSRGIKRIYQNICCLYRCTL